MSKRVSAGRLRGVWSATPTPLTEKMRLDKVSVRRLVDHHVKLGVKGLFLCGTCGEGPWMPDEMRWALVAETVQRSQGRLVVSVQVTDNSAARMLGNIKAARRAGADIAVVAPPFWLLRTTPERILQVYRETIRGSALPVGMYDRGKYSTLYVPSGVLSELYAEKNVVMVKDSSMDARRRGLALAAREKRPRLRLLTGAEFDCVPYLQAGYDGLLLGGGIFNGYLAGMIMEAVRAGDIRRAKALQNRMNRMMWEVYGGKRLRCWLSGQKKLLVEMGVFRTWRSYLEFPLTESCDRAIKRVVKREAEVLFPYRNRQRR